MEPDRSFVVAVRVRPPNEQEQNFNREVVRVLDDKVLCFDPHIEDPVGFGHNRRKGKKPALHKRSKNLNYAFDHVFDERATQDEVFQNTTKTLVDGVLDGYNGCCFAYGATGAGKTHTMLGTSHQPGVMVLTIRELFERMEESKEDKTYDIAISYLEVYNETLRDLLDPKGALPLREDDKGVTVSDLSIHKPQTAEELFDMLATGNQNRTQHPTDANAQSSRSHAVFTVYVNQRDRTAALSHEVRSAKLLLIDLAGSERATVTTNRGMRMREGANINKSLLALGNCINALVTNSQNPNKKPIHVPYRDSKLTRLLKDSLGGNSRTVMIANVSPSAMWYDDTHNTLKYANRAKNIKVRATRNVQSVDHHISEYANLVAALRNEVAELKAKLAAGAGRPSANQNVVPDIRMSDSAMAAYEQQIAAVVEERWHLLSELTRNERRERHLALHAAMLHRRLARLEAVAIDQETRQMVGATLQQSLEHCGHEMVELQAGMRGIEQRIAVVSDARYADLQHRILAEVPDPTQRRLLSVQLESAMQTVTLDNKCATMDMQDVVELQRQETVLAEECIATVAKATHAVHASLHEATGGNVAPLLANEYAQAVHKAVMARLPDLPAQHIAPVQMPPVISSLHNQGPSARQVPLTPSKTSTSPRLQRQTSAQKLRGILRAVSQRIITPTKEEHTMTVAASIKKRVTFNIESPFHKKSKRSMSPEPEPDRSFGAHDLEPAASTTSLSNATAASSHTHRHSFGFSRTVLHGSARRMPPTPGRVAAPPPGSSNLVPAGHGQSQIPVPRSTNKPRFMENTATSKARFLGDTAASKAKRPAVAKENTGGPTSPSISRRLNWNTAG